MVKYAGVEIEDEDAVKNIGELWQIYMKKRSAATDPYAFRGRDDPNYPEIMQQYDEVQAECKQALEMFVSRVNEYIESKVKRLLK